MEPLNKVGSYRDLLVWRKAIDLVKIVYQLTRDQGFPPEEEYGLVSQIRRAAVSIPSNIAEGQARGGTKEFVQFLYIGKGSLAEVDTQLTISLELGFLVAQPYHDAFQKVTELQRMLYSLIQRPEGNTHSCGS